MESSEIILQFETLDELKAEFEQNLTNGGTFVHRKGDFQQNNECTVIIVHPGDGARKEIKARIVMVTDQGDTKGVAVAFNDFSSIRRQAIEDFIKEHAASDEFDDEEEKSTVMSSADRIKRALEGDISDRIQLERQYGKAVWEELLKNPKITRGEVARIAKKGSLPKHLRRIILSNSGWMSDAQVRRAMLSNTRMDESEIKKILMSVPRAELSRMSKDMRTAPKVRRVALKMILG